MEPYIKHKKDCMPKCSLHKLHDLIVEGSHPCAEMFRRKSGLGYDRVAAGGSGDDVLTFNGGCSNGPNTGVGEEERNVGGGLCLKRSRVVSETGKGDDGSGGNAKKMKMKASYVKAKDGSRFSPKPTTSGVAPPHDPHCKVSARNSSCNREREFHIEVPHPVSVGRSKQKSIAGDGKDVREHCPGLTTLHVTLPDKAQKKVSAKESDCNSGHDSHMNITPPASADVSQKNTTADGVKNDSCYDFVAMEKRDFLNSKCTSARYFNSTRKDHCLMCNGVVSCWFVLPVIALWCIMQAAWVPNSSLMRAVTFTAPSVHILCI